MLIKTLYHIATSTLVTSFIFLPVALQSQILNFNSNGVCFRSSGETVSIIVDKKSDHGSKGLTGPVSFAGVIGSVIGLAVDVTKGILTAEEKKYTSIYAASKSENQLIYFHKAGDLQTADLNIDRVSVTRSFLNSKGDWQPGCHFSMSTELSDNSGLFRFKLDSLFLSHSKAKIRKSGRRGKRIDLSISIKLEALWKESIAKDISPKSGDSSKLKSADNDNSFQIKAAMLGETNILISSIAPEGQIRLQNDNYSGWYQLPPSTSLKFANSENNWKVGNYMITITVKEANPYAINAKDKADLFSSTGADFGNLLKQFFPEQSNKN